MDSRTVFKVAAIGLSAGIVNGLLGVGGGMILIPGMVYALGMGEHDAHGTSLAIVLPISIASALVYSRNHFVEWGITWRVALGGMIGAYIGAKLICRIPDIWLKRIFAAFMLATAARMVL
ncbi:MAG: sulfite exporter TauE/SafE family protein [Chloroflexota bacterium]